MAKLASTARPTSRQSQDAPQDAPAATAPARATRSTRSQSREPTEQPTLPQQRGKAKGGAGKKTGGRKMKEDVPAGMHRFTSLTLTRTTSYPHPKTVQLSNGTALLRDQHVARGLPYKAVHRTALPLIAGRASIHLADNPPSSRPSNRRGRCRPRRAHPRSRG